MRVVGVDVGVRHLACCLWEEGEGVVDWAVLALGGATVEAQVRSLHAELVGRPALLTADAVVIERQVRANVRMSCLANAALMFFLERGVPVEFGDPAGKMSGFGVPAGKSTYREAKARSVACARSVVHGRWAGWLEGLEKKDDAADALALAYSWLKARASVVRV